MLGGTLIVAWANLDKILTPGFYNYLSNPDNFNSVPAVTGNPYQDMHHALAANNVCNGWEPKHRIQFAHSKGDMVVPYGNYLAFRDAHPDGENDIYRVDDSFSSSDHIATGTTFMLKLGNDFIDDFEWIDAFYSMEGEGTEDSPYLIASTEDWDYLAEKVSSGESYSGKYFQMTDDISVTTMVGSSEGNSFQGTFDGNGHTLTVNYTNTTEEHTGPFRFANNATIKNLHVAGTITTDQKKAGSIIANARGTIVITNCVSSVTINSNINGDGTHGGLVATIRDNGNVTIEGCAFVGKLLGPSTTCCGGIVGHTRTGNNAHLTVRNSIFAPEETNISLSDCATFSRTHNENPNYVSITNCYYTQSFGNVQGELVFSITGSEDVTVEFAGEVTEYDVSEMTTNGTGIKYGDVLYAGDGDNLSLSLSYTGDNNISGYTVDHGTLSGTAHSGTNDLYTLAMTANNAIVSASFESELILQIASVEDWNTFCNSVNEGLNYDGYMVSLMADVGPVSNMAGTSDHPFNGFFDGQGYTLTFNANTSDNYCAPFRYANGAIFQDLKVDGTITTSNQFAAGFVGQVVNGGNGCIFANCKSNINIISSKNGDGTHGGFVANISGGSNYFTGCAFTGNITTTNGTTNCGGFAGWCETENEAAIFLTDCLFAPRNNSNISSGCKTFFRIHYEDETYCRLNNCYYTRNFGDPQGKRAYSITGGEDVTVAFADTTTTYSVSGIALYLKAGFIYDNVLYAGKNEVLSLNLSYTGSLIFRGYVTNNGILSGDENPYTLTMPEGNVMISLVSNCPTPTNVTARHVTKNSAQIRWDGHADSYSVRYRNTTNNNPIFFEGFEDGLPSTWTAIDSDGDGYNWGYHINTGSYYHTTHTGDGVAFSASYENGHGALSPDNWLITPQLDLQGTMRVWLRGQDDDYYSEHFAIYLSTTGSSLADFTTILVPESISTNEYTEFIADLGEYAGQQGYIAIRHFNCTDQFRLNVDDFGIYPNEPWNTTTVSESPFTITGLTSETEYHVQVQANCGSEDGLSVWSSLIRFTTLDDCATPHELEATNVTSTSATLGWDGAQSAYNVRYRTIPKVYFYEGFEDGVPDNWSTIDADGDGYSWYYEYDPDIAHSSRGLVCSDSYNYEGEFGPDKWLITPQVELQGFMKVWVANYINDYPDHFAIYLSTTGNSVADFLDNGIVLVDETGAPSHYYTEFIADLSAYEGQQGYIAIRHFNSKNMFQLLVDDFSIGENGEPSEWITVNNIGSNTLTLNSLILNTQYEWQVQGINSECEEVVTEWSESAFFTITEGTAFLKEISAHTNAGGWYLIASPVGMVNPENVTNMLENDFDLYRFNQAVDLEWENYKSHQSDFNIIPGQGYLYANSQDVTLIFTGEPYTGSGEVTLSKSSGVGFQGWNLVGNPFPTTAYIDREFYTMNADGSNLMASTSNSIEAMEGIFVIANTDGETMTFTPDETPAGNGKGLALNLSQGRSAVVDRAIVRFGEGGTLPKFQLRDNSTKVYIPQDGLDYAVVRSEGMGELPVNFKAEENGNYTISLSSEDVSFSYLHLVDNMTGTDVDLLVNPSYSFEAKTTDYESRFKLVFVCEDANDDNDFAFVSIGNEGEATLQVIDLNGRILSSETVNDSVSKTIKAAPGVYMIRLINGEKVKVQKIVVR